MKIVKVIKLDKKSKLKTVKVNHISNEPKSLQNIRKVKIIRFKSEYEKFCKCAKSPDEFVEQTANSIAFIYFYSKYIGMDTDMIIEEINKINYSDFMMLYVETDADKLKALGVFKKMHNGAMILLNLLLLLQIDKNSKIKIPISINNFKKAIYNKDFWCATEYKTIYRSIGCNRLYIMKDSGIIPISLNIDDLNNVITSINKMDTCNILIEYNMGQFVTLPKKCFIKLANIKKIKINHCIIEDHINEGLTNCIPIEDLKEDMDGVYWFKNSFICDGNIFQIIDKIIEYDYFKYSLDIKNNLTSDGCYSAFESVVIIDKDNNSKAHEYDKFINKFVPILNYRR